MNTTYRLGLVIILAALALAGCTVGGRSDPLAGQDINALATGTAYVAAKATARAESTGRAEWMATSDAATLRADSTSSAAAATQTAAAWVPTATALAIEAQQYARRATQTAESEIMALVGTATRIADDAERARIALRMEQRSEWVHTAAKWAAVVIGVLLVGGVVGLLLLALYRAIEAVQFRAHIVKPDENGVQPVNYLQKQPHAVHDPDQLNRLVRAASPRMPVNEPETDAGYNLPETPTIAPKTAPSALPDSVSLRALLNGDGPRLTRLALGVTVEDGRLVPVYEDLAKLVHIAVGGSTGYGKSNVLQSLAYQLALSPESPELVLCDIEAVSFSAFSQCGSLRYPVATEPADIAAVFEDLAGELDRRKALFAEQPGITKLSEYNALMLDTEPLPMIAVLCDEITALFTDERVQDAARTLALRGRKFGMVLVAGGQDWKASTIDTSIRNQFASRMQLGAMDATQSRVLLGDDMAAGIQTPGRAAAYLPGRGRFMMQTPHVTRRDLLTAFTNGHGGGARNPIPAIVENEPVTLAELDPERMQRVADELALDVGDVRRVLELERAGESLSSIAAAVFGARGGKAFYTVKDILSAFGSSSST